MVSSAAHELRLKKIISLPFIADTHALTCVNGENLWVLINQPGIQTTQLLRIQNDFELEKIAALPIVASTVNACEGGIIISGSGSGGRALIMGVTATGKISWQYYFTSTQPKIWPVAICVKQPVIAWQEVQGKIETGLLDTKTAALHNHLQIETGQASVRIFQGKDKLWTAWKEKEGIYILDLVNPIKKIIPGSKTAATDFVQAQWGTDIFTAWMDREHIWYLLPGSEEITAIPFDNRFGGVIGVSCAEHPLIWIKFSPRPGEEDRDWKITFIIPGKAQHTHNGFVYDITWWQQQVVLLCRDKIIFMISE